MSNPAISTLISKWHVIWWVCPILWYSQPIPSDRSTYFLRLFRHSFLPIFFGLASEGLATLGWPCGQVSWPKPWHGLWGVTYVADTCLLTIHPGGSHMTPPVFCWLDHITTHRWLPPSMLLWLSTRSLYMYFSIVLPRYISQACWVASSPRLDFFCCTTVVTNAQFLAGIGTNS